MGPRRKGGVKGKTKFRSAQSKNKGVKGNNKKRKTYSLYGAPKNVRETSDFDSIKRKSQLPAKIESKRQKFEDSDSQDSEDEVEDPMTQLLGTFGNELINKQQEAIESSDEDTTLNDEGQVDVKTHEDIESVCETVEPLEEEAEEAPDDVAVEDTFNSHLSYDLSSSMLKSLHSVPMEVNCYSEDWHELGKVTVQIPKCEEEKVETNVFLLSPEQRFAPCAKIPAILDNASILRNIKVQIVNNIKPANPALQNYDNDVIFTPLQTEIFSVINNYQDLYYPERTFDNAEELRFVYCVHVVNHILKTRTKVLHHNARLTTKDDVPEEFRDQGLVRPRVLIVVPFRDSAYKIIQNFIHVMIPEDKGNVINKLRFIKDYTGSELTMPKKNPKPEDYEKLFSGNTGDDFKIGITVTKKSLKLYADFYSSDIIITSPLGVRYIIGAEGEADRDYDFLASIELLILDQADVFLMQNWDHLLHIFNHLHLQPKDSHGTDVSRVRNWSLEGHSKYYRQTLILSSVVLPEINSIFNKKCFNYAGKVRVVNPVKDGTIGQVFMQLPHVFCKVTCSNVENAIDARFDYFINKILPQHREPLMKQTLIYVPNYFDYVRLRNYFKREDISFVQVCEYSKEGKIARARDMFFHGDAHFLLYTERFHFFHRKRIKGIRHLIFFQPPNFPHFYYEMCNLMQEANMNKKVGSSSNMTISVLYTKYDIHQLAAIVSTERAAKMVQSDRNVHMIVTGGD